ncbi:hypothetical protein RRG08_023044 [Elysia crispata]|uniref:Uncharacterized protein n=1 Tax=Elysia crispata TaxID=231223 RepID=A0AAE1E4C7_9GAST|nr:hypothetical protein RRG08_023044 [Elysia crispata]
MATIGLTGMIQKPGQLVSDVELGGNDGRDLDLDLENNDDDLELDLPSGSEDETGSAEEFLWSPTLHEVEIDLFTSRTPGPKLHNTYLEHSSPPIEFFMLFILDNFITRMAEQTNLYMLFKEEPHDHSSHYLMVT